ncbi:uncharacterized protein K02A2.6-like [Paramacrobiotus metropolitanus]|uniref:uncharacterized protein K02A2.6-like n=1 Tax=Paramacrobiotus metropolitanus TaxID=2943436 RepID=UPI0024456363|nr:uncharacterized protein K02A2.6-like [Paramacrobiotus metropolitanus]
MGTVEIQVQHMGVAKVLRALVTTRGCSIIGRDWISELDLSALSLKQLQLGEVSSAAQSNLREAYNQIPVDEDSSKLLVINTHKGLFKYNRLPFGVASAPSIFQQVMENILQDCEGVAIYLDDIIIIGRDEAECLRNLEALLARLEQYDLTVKKDKCEFMVDSVEYLGFIID